MAGVARYMLLSDHVGWATNPVYRVFASVSVDVGVNRLGGWQFWELLIVSGELKFVKLLRTAAAETNFSIDLTWGLSYEALLGGDETSVPWKVLTVPATIFVWHTIKGTVGSPRSLRHCLANFNCKLSFIPPSITSLNPTLKIVTELSEFDSHHSLLYELS